MPSTPRWFAVVCCTVVAVAPTLQAGADLDTLQRHAEPLPAVLALAAAQHIPLAGIDGPRDQQKLQPGDTLTALFTLTDGGRVQQWLGEVKIVPLTDAERTAKPDDTVIYTGTGGEFHLASPPAAYALRMFGPITDAAAPRNGWPLKQARFTLKEDFLSFGFDRMAELALRLRQIGEEIRIGVMTGRFNEDQIAAGKRWAAKASFTADDELVCAKQAFACVEFLMLADRTPGFKEIVRATVSRPSLWTAVLRRNFGLFFNYDWKNLTRHEGVAFGFADPVYHLPFSLTVFGSHVANGAWIVTAARPPLLASAGIIGLTVEPPDRKDKRLEMRIVAARHAAH